LQYFKEEDSRKLILFTNQILIEKLDNTNRKIIIDDKAQSLATMDSGFRYLINNEKYAEMADVYILLNISDKKETYRHFTCILEEYIKGEGEKIATNDEINKDPKSKIKY
jgi:hypothetical protein